MRGIVALALHEDVEHLAFAVHRTPQPKALARDCDRHLVQVPLRGRPRATAAQLSCEQRSELPHPAPNGFVGQIEPALGQQVLDVAIAQGKAQIQPDRMLDDSRRELVTGIGDRGALSR